MAGLSICIPTYNRAKHLQNCLASVISAMSNSTFDVQVCVSDNASTDNTQEVIRAARQRVSIAYDRNPRNLGIPRNFINVVKMARGEFVWLLGDDDLLMPSAIEELCTLLGSHPHVDFFCVNSFHLTTEHVFSFDQPFDTANLPHRMRPVSSLSFSGEMKFLDLIDPKVSFDFLGGMFLSVFRRELWNKNVGVLDKSALADARMFSHFDNTFPHVKIFAHAFARSNAYFHAKPLSVNLKGAREWAPMYPFVHSVRLIEALAEYRRNGLPLWRYLLCKNYALNNFIPDLGYMILHPHHSGLAYIHPWKLFLQNCLYPNLYVSVIAFLARRLKRRSTHGRKNAVAV